MNLRDGSGEHQRRQLAPAADGHRVHRAPGLEQLQQLLAGAVVVPGPVAADDLDQLIDRLLLLALGVEAQREVEAVIDELNSHPDVTGYIVQLPLPFGIDTNEMLELIDPNKDADGLHPVNLGRLVLGIEAPLPCTPAGIVELLRRYNVNISGAEVAVVGRGITVGRPLGLLLTRRSENATVTLCHTGTRDLAFHTKRADIVVMAAGVPHMLTPDMVKPGAAVLDVGITRTDAGLLGDVHPDVREVAGHLAPMPGGTGPMTRAMLVANVVEAAERQLKHR
mgnify:CR=1 FL=1